MPVQSKIIAGRGRKPPPVPAPKPILKQRGTQRTSHEKSATLRFFNGPSHADAIKVEFTFPQVDKDKVDNYDSSYVEDKTEALQIDRNNITEGATGEEQGQYNIGNKKDAMSNEGLNPQTTKPKHGRPRFRESIGGNWALKECEVGISFFLSLSEHTHARACVCVFLCVLSSRLNALIINYTYMCK